MVAIITTKTTHMKNQITVILINVNASGSCGESTRKICENIEGTFIDDFDNHAELSGVGFDDDLSNTEECSESYIVYPLTDFMDAFNNEEIDQSKWFMTWVRTSK